MEIDRGTFESALIHHAERQTKALEAMNNRFQLLVILLGVLGALGLFAWLSAVYG